MILELPEAPAGFPWCLVVDTALASPGDIANRGAETVVNGSCYRVAARSAVVLLSAHRLISR